MGKYSLPAMSLVDGNGEEVDGINGFHPEGCGTVWDGDAFSESLMGQLCSAIPSEVLCSLLIGFGCSLTAG